MQQPGRVQFVGQRLHIGRDLHGLLLKRIQAAQDLAEASGCSPFTCAIAINSTARR